MKTCWNCKEVISEKNTFTNQGWKEADISGLCERCFDDITLPDDDLDINGIYSV